jgi:FAD/FMN-containing dehydrogenase
VKRRAPTSVRDHELEESDDPRNADARPGAAQRALASWDAGRMYLNFAEQPRSGRSLFGEDGYARLRRLKTEIDPENVFHANHQVEPADRGRRRAAGRRMVDSQRRAA